MQLMITLGSKQHNRFLGAGFTGNVPTHEAAWGARLGPALSPRVTPFALSSLRRGFPSLVSGSGTARISSSASGAMASEEGAPSSSSSSTPIVRRVRIHKQRLTKDDTVPDAASNAAMDRRIAELIPALAELSVTAAEPSTSQLASASAVRQRVQSREEARRAEVLELGTLFDMSKPHPCEEEQPAGGAGAWSQSLRPRVRKVVLSPYQYEMINYQRMLMRKNVWYYRDRMNVPRGPCPLHVLKDAWVQGVIDENTLMWGQGLYDWLPAKNVKLLLPMIRTPEVRLGAWMKRTFSLKPALNKIREARKDYRDPSELSKQVEYMR